MATARRKCRWRRDAALRGKAAAEARACYQGGVHALFAHGFADLLDGAVRAKPISRALAALVERNAAPPALLALVGRFENFARWCRRERAWIRAQIAKENAPARGH